MTLAFVTPIIALAVDAIFEKGTVFTGETYLGIAIVLVSVAMSVLVKDPKVLKEIH
jgi:energy-converting hydrogenase Eha subunit A